MFIHILLYLYTYTYTGDEGIIDDEGYVFVTSRCDDVINVAGHRISTGAIEEVRIMTLIAF